MNSQENNANNTDVLNIAEWIAVACSFGGSIAAIFLNQILLASIPLSITVTLNLVNRKQLLQSLEQQISTTHQSDITEVKQELETNTNNIKEEAAKEHSKLTENITEVEQKISADLQTNMDQLNKYVQQLEAQQKQLEEIVGNLKDIENLSQAISINPNAADVYYQRGLRHQQLGDKSGAIKDYTEAIAIAPNFAKAYHNRGILYVEVGERQRAVDDLRKASLLYFEQGELDSYEKAREMSKNVHNIHHMGENGKIDQVSVGGLFS